MTLISTMTFNLTLQQVNHVTTNPDDLCFNFVQGRSPRLDFEEWSHRAFVSVDMHESSGKVGCVFLPFPKAVILITQWQAENATTAEAPRTFACFLPLSPSCVLSKTRCCNEKWNQSHTPFDLWDHPYSRCQVTIPRFEKRCVLTSKIRNVNILWK